MIKKTNGGFWASYSVWTGKRRGYIEKDDIEFSIALIEFKSMPFIFAILVSFVKENPEFHHPS